jgi:cobalt-zinc-cadmium efflux system protein
MSETNKAANLERKVKLGIALNTGFTIFEFVIGISSGSLALVSDAGHNLTDALSLVITYFAQKISKREANREHSYGYGRATILAALLNGIVLVLLAVYIFYEAFSRFLHPEPVVGNLVTIVAFVGILVNGSVAYLFSHNKDDLNIQSAYTNMFFDTLASVGALLAGFLIILTKQSIFDALISVFIGTLLLRSSWEIIGKATRVLLEGVPEGTDINKIKETIVNNPHIKQVDDLHIWAISSHFAALSCHVVIEGCDLEESIKIVKEIKEELHKKQHIQHATIETELTECLPNERKNDE